MYTIYRTPEFLVERVGAMLVITNRETGEDTYLDHMEADAFLEEAKATPLEVLWEKYR